MFYLGCLPFLAIILLVVVLSFVLKLFRTSFDVFYGLLLSIQDWFYGLFRPKPQESEIEDMNYYRETQEREKLYDKDDGEYVSFKTLKH